MTPGSARRCDLRHPSGRRFRRAGGLILPPAEMAAIVAAAREAAVSPARVVLGVTTVMVSLTKELGVLE